MANTIKLKNSGTTTNSPSALEYGELAINYADGKLFYKDDAGGIVDFANARSSVSDTAPSNPSEGDIWFESDTGDVYVYYDSVWVDVGGTSVANIAMSDTAPSSPVNGDFWFETDTGRTFVYYDDGTSQQWIEVGATSAAANGSDGAIQFASGGTFASDASNFYWDDTNNRLGIGTTSPSQTLDVRGIARVGDDTDRTPDAAGVGHLMVDGNGYGGFVSLDAAAMWVGHNSASRDLYLATNETARVTINTSGNVGIGTTSPQTPLHISQTGADALRIQKSNNDQQGAYISYWDDNSRLGYVGYAGNDDLYLENEASAGNTFLSTAGVVRMTINSSGNVGIGTTSPSGVFHVYGSGEDLMKFGVITGNQYLYLNAAYNRTTASAGTSQRLESSGVFRRSTSAAKYKKDVEDMDVDRAEVVYDLRPVWYRSAIETDDPNKSYYGFIADEVVDLDPRLVEFDDDGEVEGFHYQTLTSHLVKIVQMQKAEIDTLTARIEALEAG